MKILLNYTNLYRGVHLSLFCKVGYSWRKVTLFLVPILFQMQRNCTKQMKKLFNITLSLFLFLQLQQPAFAGKMTEAYNAYISGDFATTLKLIKPLAESGDMEAEFTLGYFYENGHVTELNIAEAAKWYRKAADQGDAISQIGLGRLYEKGKGIEQNFVEAAKFYRLAAEQGSARGHFRLANLYELGEGVPKDLILAHMHFNIAAAGFTILPAEERRDSMAKLLTPEQQSEARRLGREWMTAHPPKQLLEPSDGSQE